MLHRYQVAGVEWLLRGKPRKLLADEAGLGKSAQAITACLRLRVDSLKVGGVAPRVLTIAPKRIVDSWREQWALWGGNLRVQVGDPRPHWATPGGPDVWITWPQALGPAWDLQSAGPGGFVQLIDEPHMHRTTSSKWTRAIASWGRLALRVWGLDGTPMYNDPAGMYALLCMLGCAPPRGMWDVWVSRVSVHRDLTDSGVLLQRTMTEVEGDLRLPPLLRSTVLLPLPRTLLMSPEWYGASTGAALRILAGRAKADALALLLERERLRRERATVCWYVHREAAKDACERLCALGIRAGLVHGGLSKKTVDSVVSDFQNSTLDFIVATQCLSAGVQLQRARQTVLCEIAYEPRARAQATARMWRCGQVATTEELTVLWDHTVDMHALGLVHSKAGTLERLGF